MYHSSLKYAKILLFFSIVIALLTITTKQSLMAEMENAKIMEQNRKKEEQEIIKQFLEKNNTLNSQPQTNQQISISKEQLAQEEFNKGNIDSAIAIYKELLNQSETNKDEIKNKLIECYKQKGLNEEINQLIEEDTKNQPQIEPENNSINESNITSNQNNLQ